jgi:polar amino acid transport system substrate-binding protein
MRSVRSLALAALVGAMVVGGSAGCAAIQPADGGTTPNTAPTTADGSDLNSMLPEKIRDAGRLVVVTDPTYPPFESLTDDQKTIIGLDPDLLEALSERLGVSVELQRAGFDTIIPGLQAKRWDMAMSGMTDATSRQSLVTFVDYHDIGGAILLRADDPLVGSTDVLSELCDRLVGVQTGTTTIQLAEGENEKCAAAGEGEFQISTFPSVPSALLALESGRVDYVWTDAVSGATQAQQSEGRFVSMDDHTDTSPAGMVFPKESTELVAAIQAALQELIDDGTYAQIIEKYNLQDYGVKSAQINSATR